MRETVSGDFGPEIAKNVTEGLLQEVRSGSPRFQLVIRVEAIHEILSRNFVRYTSKNLRGDPNFKLDEQVMPTGVYSWTSPFPKPVLVHHMVHDRDPLGRVVAAEYVRRTRFGPPGIITTAKISDPDAIEKIRDGRYMTVSIGAHPHKLRCSICGEDVSTASFFEPHSHVRGQYYEDKLAYVEPEQLWFEEQSFVNAPGDPGAQVVDPGQFAPFEMVMVDTITNEVVDLGRGVVLREVAPETLLQEGACEQDLPRTASATSVFILPPLKGGTSEVGKSKTPAQTAPAAPTAAEPTGDASAAQEPLPVEIPEELEEDPSVAGIIEILYQQQDDIEELEGELKEAHRTQAQIKEHLRELHGRIHQALELLGEEMSAQGASQGTPPAAPSHGPTPEEHAQLRQEYDALVAAHQQTLEELAQLDRKLRRLLAEQVVDLRVRLGRLDRSQAPQRAQELVERPVEVLEALWEELREEAEHVAETSQDAAAPASVPPQPIEPPASVKHETLTPSSASANPPGDLTAYQVFKRLLTGRK